MAGVRVINEDLTSHPCCPHGPTLLFQTLDQGKQRNFYACSACRDRKLCSIFVWQDERNTYRKRYWDNKIAKYQANTNPQNLFKTFTLVQHANPVERMYCYDCSEFQLARYQSKHSEHKHKKQISDKLLKNPSAFLEPSEDSKFAAQYLFSHQSSKFIVETIIKLKFKYVLCIGAPRIHEYIINNCPVELDSLLMDIDKRYLAFYSSMKFVWYNMFNHHFFVDGSKGIYRDFLNNNKGDELIIVTDPPFGGRIEPIFLTLTTINMEHQELKNIKKVLPLFWVFPYFMEPQLKNVLEDFTMLDYKVHYDNHQLFTLGANGNKLGSPVRIFTNIKPSIIPLPMEEGYKHCEDCKRWVSEENQHCYKCNGCTSKDGRTYVHCDTCNRCVKPSWIHCATCSKCAVSTHKCEIIPFKQECFVCKKPGHKRSECPDINTNDNMEKEKCEGENKAKSLKVSKTSKGILHKSQMPTSGRNKGKVNTRQKTKPVKRVRFARDNAPDTAAKKSLKRIKS